MPDEQRHPPTTKHNWLRKVLALADLMLNDTEEHVDIEHDEWCDEMNGRGFCNCDPEVKVRRYND